MTQETIMSKISQLLSNHSSPSNNKKGKAAHGQHRSLTALRP